MLKGSARLSRKGTYFMSGRCSQRRCIKKTFHPQIVRWGCLRHASTPTSTIGAIVTAIHAAVTR